MSEASAPATFPEASTLSHSPPPPKLSTNLLDFPPNASFQIYRKPKSGITPVQDSDAHVSEVISGDDTIVLICFASTATDDWSAIKREIAMAQAIGLTPLIVAAVDIDQIASALYGAVSTLFVPNLMLRKILGINRNAQGTHNALILIRNGQVAMTWRANDGYDIDRQIKPYDWTGILGQIG